ncbi:DNA-binding NarL/FixJ family response regulator [Nakamurella sp. UYEF19]|uniref:response regulator transcription factor n=1 Tax=Nakamurella sp. UYEF19 TaxID=1756392 RepID=UPI00339A2FD9
MATTALLAWSDLDPAPESLGAVRAGLVERHGGRPTSHPAVILFAGASSAMQLAVSLQRLGLGTSIAVGVFEIDETDHADQHAKFAWIMQLARQGQAGDILATDIVHMLLPTVSAGEWTSGGTELDGVHRLDWRGRAAAERLRVVVAEDVALIRAGIVSLLRAEGISVVAEAADYETMLSAVRATRPALLIADIRMPPGHGDEGLRAARILRTEQRDLAVLILSQHVQASAAADLLDDQSAGIGYLLKERVTKIDEFLEAARTVASGGTVIDPMITSELLARHRTAGQLSTLADRERTVLELMAQGLSNVAIADRLVLSARTVESHVRSILTKLDIWDDPAGNRRVQAVIQWLDQR